MQNTKAENAFTFYLLMYEQNLLTLAIIVIDKKNDVETWMEEMFVK